jgi:hypothetical protein|tara:strand:- start:5 stop:187 length:183 start_codon:yes stop_codon:yes gene_type:complete
VVSRLELVDLIMVVVVAVVLAAQDKISPPQVVVMVVMEYKHHLFLEIHQILLEVLLLNGE